MQPVIIGIYSPRPQSGKSTIAEWLVRERGFVRIPFAQPMKAMARVLFTTLGYSERDMRRFESGDKTDVIDECGRTVRHIYQTLATEWGRDLIHPKLWVRAWEMLALQAIVAGAPGIVADDCRFVNEVMCLRTLGGKVWRVVRDVGNDPAFPAHVSEGGLDRVNFDLTLINNAGLADLHAMLAGQVPEKEQPHV